MQTKIKKTFNNTVKRIMKINFMVYLVIMILFIVFFSLRYLYNKRPIIVENTENVVIVEEQLPPRLSNPSKCFSCERDMVSRCGEGCAWSGMKAKSFDAESDLVTRRNVERDGFGGKTLKYY